MIRSFAILSYKHILQSLIVLIEKDILLILKYFRCSSVEVILTTHSTWMRYLYIFYNQIFYYNVQNLYKTNIEPAKSVKNLWYYSSLSLFFIITDSHGYHDGRSRIFCLRKNALEPQRRRYYHTAFQFALCVNQQLLRQCHKNTQCLMLDERLCELCINLNSAFKIREWKP